MSATPKAHIRQLKPYEPGKPISELERELGIRDSIKLASNENPLGPSPKALVAMGDALEAVHRYPDGHCFALRRALATRLSIDPEQLIFGTGSDELLELLAKCFLGAGDEVVFAWPSFAMYPIVTAGMGAQAVHVPLRDDLVHDLEAMAAAVNERTKLVLLCNPNNPTGTSFGAKAFQGFVQQLPDHVILVVDEAYVEYVGRDDFPDALHCVATRLGSIVLRTFSKIYGLAGLRIGYGIGDIELVSWLERARHPFNVNSLAQAAALAALEDSEHVEASRQLNFKGLAFLRAALGERGFETWPSDANFLLVRSGPGVAQRLLAEGVIVRDMAGFGLQDCLRISVGCASENERLIKALDRIGVIGDSNG